MSDVVRHEIFSMPGSSMPNVPAVLTRVSSANDPAMNGPGGESAIEPMCSGRYFEYGMMSQGPRLRRCWPRGERTATIVDAGPESQEQFPMLNLRVAAAILALVLAAPTIAPAQDWPSRPIHF